MSSSTETITVDNSTPSEASKVSRGKIFTFIYGFARPYLLPLIIGTILYCSQSIMFPFMNSVLLGGIADAMTSGEISQLLTAGLNVLGVTILAMLMAFFGVLLYASSTMKTTRRLQVGMLRSFMRSGAEDHTHSGERLSMLNTDVTAAGDLYSNALSGVLFSLMPMIILSVVIFVMEWRIGVFTILLGLFSTVGQMLFAKPIARISKKTLETTASATRTIGDIFSGGIIARVFHLEKHMLNIFGHDNDELRRLVFREARVDGARGLVSGISDLLTTGASSHSEAY